MAVSGTLQITDQDIRTVMPLTQLSGLPYGRSDTQFGAFAQTTDGRQYAFGLNGASATVAGLVQTGQPVVANHAGRTLAVAVQVGSNTISVPLGATAATVDQYIGGFLSVVSGPGAGTAFRVRSNSAAPSSGTTLVTIDDQVNVTLTTSSVVTLLAHPDYLFTTASATVTTNNYVGVPNVAVPASNYAWLQTNGYCQVTTDAVGTTAKNTGVIGSATVAGAVQTEAATTVTQRIGYAVDAIAASTTGLVNLQIV